MISVAEINDRVQKIRDVYDPVAHSMEDDLYRCVLTAIAAGQCEDPVGCAKAALKTSDIEFYRWYE